MPSGEGAWPGPGSQPCLGKRFSPEQSRSSAGGYLYRLLWGPGFPPVLEAKWPFEKEGRHVFLSSTHKKGWPSGHWALHSFTPSFIHSSVHSHIQKYCLVPFSSVAQLCSTLCDPMNHSMPGLAVHHQLPESTQTHVHWVGDAIQPSHPLSSPSPALNLSQHQGLFKILLDTDCSSGLEPGPGEP